MLLLSFLVLATIGSLQAQDSSRYRLMLQVPLLDVPQNIDLPQRYPSMYQAMQWSNDLYDLGFYAIHKISEAPLLSYKGQKVQGQLFNKVFAYGLGLAFAKYGSELPIPLGVWGHEEFHRSVLGVAGLHPKNGNWIMSRWDGTVYGLSDQGLDALKAANPSQLLYSYTAGVQYEALLNEEFTLNGLYYQRTANKAPLLLYNAWYVYNYFKFSTSAISDSVKVIAPKYESADPTQRDYAGADLTAWAFDMFQPQLPFSARSAFPNGDGVNRRVGFGDLSAQAQDFLRKQQRLSLLNFVNPAIFFVDRIKLSNNLSFNFLLQYLPTHFGNSLALVLPVNYRGKHLLLKLNRYEALNAAGWGATAGLRSYPLGPKWQLNAEGTFWSQPSSFFASESKTGAAATVGLQYKVSSQTAVFAQTQFKTAGWLPGNPYLDANVSGRLGFNYSLMVK